MKQVGWSIVVAMLTWLVPAPAAAQGKTLDIYFIDVEGGQATLVVTPAGEALLIDTGFASDGTFASVPGDPQKARDANRILAAARAAGVKAIDYLLITHFHADHDGGVPELARCSLSARLSTTACRRPTPTRTSPVLRRRSTHMRACARRAGI